MKELEIVELPTRSIKGHFIPHRNLIEISSLYDKETHDMILNHELQHAKIYAEHGLYTWRHFALDLKDRWHIYSTKGLVKKVLHYEKRPLKEKLKEAPFAIMYMFFGIVTEFPMEILGPITVLLKRNRK